MKKLACIMALCAVGCAADDDLTEGANHQSQAAVDSADKATLYTWYNATLRDFRTTTAWTGAVGDQRPDGWRLTRIDGALWSPTLAAAPLDTAPVYRWESAARHDSILVSGTARDAELSGLGYVRQALEGYINTLPLANTVRLRSFWSRERQDNLVTTDPNFATAGYAPTPTLGYVFPNFDWQPPAVDPTLFGYDSHHTVGTRPLMAVLRGFTTPAVPPAHDAAYHRARIFGAAPSVTDFFRQSSDGQFRFTNAGLFEVTEPVPGAGDEAIVRAAATANIDFARYDTNHDGHVTTDELALVVITADGVTCAASRHVNGVVLRSQNVTLDLFVSFVGDRSGIATIAHEVSHQLGTEDLYGRSSLMNQRATLMAGTCGAPDSATMFDLDAWHKMSFGWRRPRVTTTDDPASAYLAFQRSGDPVVLFDPARGTRDFLLFEMRAPHTSYVYDDDVADDGVAVWHVQVDEAGHLVRLPYAGDSDGLVDDEVNSVLNVRAVTGNVGPGAGDFFEASDGRRALSWPSLTQSVLRPTGSSLLVDALPAGQGSVGFELGDNLLPFLDGAALHQGWRGSEMRLPGTFGVRGARVVSAKRGTQYIDLPVTRWDLDAQVRVQIPADMPLGDYELAVYDGPNHTRRGNRVPLRVYAASANVRF